MNKQVAAEAAKVKPPRTKHNTVPEPMRIILERAPQIEQYYALPYRVPQQNSDMVRDAALAFAEYNNSDPFAYGRMLTHLLRGIESAFQVSKEYRAKNRMRHTLATLRRNGSPVNAPETLQE